MAIQTAPALGVPSIDGEPGWLGTLRADWWRRVEAHPWPDPAEEEWRRTSLDALPRDGELLLEPPIATYELDPALAARGVIFSDLATAVREHGDLVRAHLGRNDTLVAQMPFWGRSMAAWTGGTFLYVPARVAIDDVLTARTTLPDGAYTYLPHTLVVLEEDASATLLEEISSPDGETVWFGGTADLQL
ncbi:MAG TPA: hypothetical protein VIP52_08910, partial [Candidatus Dormibacteraeota bacterium]